MTKILSSEVLFITLTLDPSMYVFKSTVQHEHVKPILNKIFSKNIEYVCMAELTKNFNVHYHILILKAPERKNFKFYWKNKFRRGNSGRLCELGFTKIDNVTTDEQRYKAYNYMMKDAGKTETMLKDIRAQRLGDFWGDVIKNYDERRMTERGILKVPARTEGEEDTFKYPPEVILR